MILSNGYKLSTGNFVAFKDPYYKNNTEVGEIVWLDESRMSVIFLSGFKSEVRDLNREDVIAYVDEKNVKQKISIEGWNGFFEVLK